MSEAKMGAIVIYCGHRGTFAADIFKLGNWNVVKANGPVTPDNINRKHLRHATHHVEDWPVRGFWCPERGIFVVPIAQVTERKRQ